MLTQQRLKQLLRYDPETGLFWWVVPRRGVQMHRPAGRANAAGHGYCEIGVDGKLYRTHRLAFLYMEGELPDGDVDHIDRNRVNNSWANLRLASRSENCANTETRANNTSGHPGVVWDKTRGKWRAQIRLGGKKTNLGRFLTFEEAKAAHDIAAKQEFGAFANV